MPAFLTVPIVRGNCVIGRSELEVRFGNQGGSSSDHGSHALGPFLVLGMRASDTVEIIRISEQYAQKRVSEAVFQTLVIDFVAPVSQ